MLQPWNIAWCLSLRLVPCCLLSFPKSGTASQSRRVFICGRSSVDHLAGTRPAHMRLRFPVNLT